MRGGGGEGIMNAKEEKGGCKVALSLILEVWGEEERRKGNTAEVAQ